MVTPALFEAARTGELSLVTDVLEEGDDINVKVSSVHICIYNSLTISVHLLCTTSLTHVTHCGIHNYVYICMCVYAYYTYVCVCILYMCVCPCTA